MACTRLSALLFCAALTQGCASPAQAPSATAAAATPPDCIFVTGSNICRKEGSGRIANVNAISGEVLRRSPESLTGALPTKTGD